MGYIHTAVRQSHSPVCSSVSLRLLKILHTHVWTKQETSCIIFTVRWFVMGNGEGGNRKVIKTCGRNKKLIYMFFIGNSMQKDNRGDRETDVRIILKCMSEKGQVL